MFHAATQPSFHVPATGGPPTASPIHRVGSAPDLSSHVLFFDLDDTLYPKDCGIHAVVFANIKLYLEQVLRIPAGDVPELTLRYYSSHGTTLAGLVVRTWPENSALG